MEKQRCVKMDEIMKNMLILSLHDVFKEEREKGSPLDLTGNLVLKLDKQEENTKLFLTDAEHGKAIEALNKLRDTYLAAGRYTDGIDTVFVKILKAKYKRCAANSKNHIE